MASEPDISRIWLTYKARMNTERRLRKYGIVAHLAITWYAFLLIVIGVFQPQISLATSDVVSSFAIVLSVLVFGLSLIFYGFRFEEQAAKFRECYLTLQRLYQSLIAPAEKLAEYNKLLEHYPNHSEGDYDRLVFDSWRRGAAIYNSEGPIHPTTGLIAKGYGKIVAQWIVIGAAFAWPIAVAAVFVR